MIDTSQFVVHCKHSPYDVYIGRPGKWGNPFSHLGESSAPVQCSSREDAVACYRDWIFGGQQVVHERLNRKYTVMVRPTIEEIKRELRGKVLGCWCAPRACHGHVLAEIANEI